MSVKSPFALGLLLASFSCSLPCEPVSPVPQQLCHQGSAIAPDTSFVLEARGPIYTGTCQVRVDGGSIELIIGGVTCGAFPPNARPAQPGPAVCIIPPLAAGSYTVNTPTPTQLNVTAFEDSGVPPCL